MRTFKIYYLSNFQIHNAMFFIIVTMLYMTLPGFIHLISGSLCPFTHFFLPSLPALAITSLSFVSMSWGFVDIIEVFLYNIYIF